ASKTPPLRTTASFFRAASTPSSRCCAARHTSLQRTIECALGKVGVSGLTQRQGASPQRTRPNRRASGCRKWRSVVAHIRRTLSKKIGAIKVREAQRLQTMELVTKGCDATIEKYA